MSSHGTSFKNIVAAARKAFKSKSPDTPKKEQAPLQKTANPPAPNQKTTDTYVGNQPANRTYGYYPTADDYLVHYYGRYGYRPNDSRNNSPDKASDDTPRPRQINMTEDWAIMVLRNNFDSFDNASKPGSKCDRIVSEADLIAVRDGEDFEDYERAAAKYILENKDLFEKLDTDGDGKIIDMEVDDVYQRSKQYNSAIEVLYTHFDEFDNAANPDSKPDGYISDDDLRAVRDDPNAAPMLRQAANYLLNNKEFHYELLVAHAEDDRSQISNLSWGDVLAFKLEHHDLDMTDYSWAMYYARQHPNTPEGQKAAAFAVEVLLQQHESVYRPELEKLLKYGEFEGLVSAAVQGQAQLDIPEMDVVEKLIEAVNSDGYLVNDPDGSGPCEFFERMDPEVQSALQMQLFTGVMTGCAESPAAAAYISNNPELKDTFALYFVENFDAIISNPSYNTIPVDIDGVDTEAKLFNPDGIEAVTVLFNIISTPPPSQHAPDAIEAVMNGVNDYIERTKDPEVATMDPQDDRFWKLQDEGQNWGAILAATGNGLSRTATSIVDGKIAADQSKKDALNTLIGIVAAGAGGAGGVPGAFAAAVAEEIAVGMVENLGGKYTHEKAVKEMEDGMEEHDIKLGETNRTARNNLALQIGGSTNANSLRGFFLHGLGLPKPE